jgi:AcrR family transcriptional regulator
MNKREMIINKSLEVFVEFGFHGAPITKLIKSAGVSNGTFFYYFKTKEDLITAIYVATKEELYDVLGIEIEQVVSLKKSIRELWMKWVIWGSEHEQKFKFLELFSNSPYVHQLNKEEMKNNFTFVQQLLRKGIEEEVIVSMDIRLLSELIYSNIRGTILFNQRNGMLSEVEMESVFNLMWKSIVNF